MQNEILFGILALLTLVSAAAMIIVKRPIDAALSFIVTLVSMAGLFALMGSAFLFAVQLIIYAGAILSLILFIIMFLNIKDANLPDEPHKLRWMATASAIVLPFCFVLVELIFQSDLGPAAPSIESFGTIRTIGMDLFSNWVVPFELISILLLVALIGAVTLASREGDEA